MRIDSSANPKSFFSAKNRFALCLAGLAVTSLLVGIFAFLIGVYYTEQGYTKLWKMWFSNYGNKIKAVVDPPVWHTMQIDMSFKNFLKIEKKRQEALERGILAASSEDYVSAKISMDGKEHVRVKMRIKGDWADHYDTRKKISFRIKVRDSNAIMGMRVLSLQHPRTRSYGMEWIYHRHLKHEGILGLRYDFVQVLFNGEDWGVYALEEHFSKELPESMKRREGVMLRFDETDFFVWSSQRKDALLNQSLTAVQLDTFQRGKVFKKPALGSQYKTALQLIEKLVDRKVKPSDVFKVEETAKFLALSELWDASHGFIWNNLRFYYDPAVGKLECVGFDAAPKDKAAQYFSVLFTPFAALLMSDGKIAEKVVSELKRYSSAEYAAQLQKDLNSEWQEAEKKVHTEWPGWQKDIWKRLNSKQAFLRRVFSVTSVAAARAVSSDSKTITIRAVNRLNLPVEILNFKSGKNILPFTDSAEKKVLFPENGKNVILVAVNKSEIKDQTEIVMECRISGLSGIHKIPVVMTYVAVDINEGRPDFPAVNAVLDKHSFLKYDKDTNSFSVSSGRWDVSGDLILPEGAGLVMTKKTVLLFDPGAVVLLTGKIDWRGTDKNPVSFLPSDKNWGGIAVIASPSVVIKNTKVSGCSGINRGGWQLLGGLNIIDSVSDISGSFFTDSASEDALNIVRGITKIENCRFTNCASDAFDGDFIIGTVSNVFMEDIKGDGLDVSGSKLTVENCKFDNISDKAMSIGESSNVKADRIVVNKSRFGVVSKDKSTLRISQSIIRNSTYGVVAYQKKKEYGPAVVSGSEIKFKDVKHESMVQERSTGRLNGAEINPQPVDVDKLYE
ncbi:MAG: right-handed parallel beta-helix repeat-containing protein [Planctomycetota bacterium]|jgi:hypothetical protein